MFYLRDGEVLQDTVHHVLLGEVLELVDEVDHVFAQRRAVDSEHVATPLKASILRLENTRITHAHRRVVSLFLNCVAHTALFARGYCPTLSIYISVCQTTCLSAHLYTCLSVCLPVCLAIHLPTSAL